MNRSLLSLALSIIIVVPALCLSPEELAAKNARMLEQKHMQQQRVYKEEYKRSVKHIPPVSKKHEIKKKVEPPKKEIVLFNKAIYEENMARLQAKLDRRKKMTQKQKDKMMDNFKTRHSDKIMNRDGLIREDAEIFSIINNDTTMSRDKKNEAINEHNKLRDEETKKFMEERKNQTGL